jgi:hypothetical protein
MSPARTTRYARAEDMRVRSPHASGEGESLSSEPGRLGPVCPACFHAGQYAGAGETEPYHRSRPTLQPQRGRGEQPRVERSGTRGPEFPEDHPAPEERAGWTTRLPELG